MMKNLITTLSIILLFSNSSCKDYSATSNKAIKQDNIRQDIDFINQEQTFEYRKWDSINKSDENYFVDGLQMQLKSFLDTKNNKGGKKLYLNDEEIDFIVSDAYIFTPYLFQNNNQTIVLVQEEDEGGIYGYLMYILQGKKKVKKTYLDISAPGQNIPIDKFLEFKVQNNTITTKILTDEYYDTKSDQIKKSKDFNFAYNKDNVDAQSIVQNADPYSSAFNLTGQWQIDCSDNKGSNILFYNENEATIMIYNDGNFVATLMLEYEKRSKSLKYIGTTMIGENFNPQNTVGLSKGDVISIVEFVKDGRIALTWKGLYNTKSKQKIYTENPFSENKSYTLKKCKN